MGLLPNKLKNWTTVARRLTDISDIRFEYAIGEANLDIVAFPQFIVIYMLPAVLRKATRQYDRMFHLGRYGNA
jgi:hypothetical protein